MAKRINFEILSKQQKMIKNGVSSVWEGTPPAESWTSLQRYNQLKSKERRDAQAKIPIALANCPLCGHLVGKMKRHLQKTHGALPGHEHETPIISSDDKN
jgi:hypothetical protein